MNVAAAMDIAIPLPRGLRRGEEGPSEGSEELADDRVRLKQMVADRISRAQRMSFPM